MKGGLVEDASTGKTELACSPLMEASLYCHKLMFCSDEQLARVKCPTFIHSGSRSKMFLPAIFEDMVDKWPRTYSLADPIPGGSHVMIMEKPAEVAQNILENLAKLEPFRTARTVKSRL
jgi:pimeloyl-ACP methyl ester carboxylesterase